MEIINLKVPNKTIWESVRYAEDLGILKNSIRAGTGNLGGFVAEKMVAEYLGAKHKNTFNYDLLLDGLKIDVKNKQTNYVPLDDYDCSVAKYNPNQKCDVYLFTRSRGPTKDLWILGWLPKKEFFEKATIHRKGDKDPKNNFTFRADCYNVKVYQLNKISEIGLAQVV